MRKEDFKELLTDLYAAYNPDFIKYVPQLVDKYNRLEFDAVQNILIKYNHESYAHYDPSKATDDYIHSLIKDYSEGNRSLKDFTIEMHIKRKQEQEANKTEEQKKIEEEAQKKTQEELSGVKSKLTETEKKIEEAQRQLDERLEKLKEQLKQTEPTIQKTSMYDDVEISIKSNYTESELVLPNKEVLAGLGKGTRVIVQDKAGKMVGLIVEEILYDCVSHPMGTPIVEIIINKG
jgi:vacuolar-type H+-ATPase subunit I/STV1